MSSPQELAGLLDRVKDLRKLVERADTLSRIPLGDIDRLTDCTFAIAAVVDGAKTELNALTQPETVTDEMVARAWEAYEAKAGYSKTERFRAAILSSLKASSIAMEVEADA